MKKIIHSVLLASTVLAASMSLHAMENKLVVVTSFPKDLTKEFKSAFEKKNPGLKIEMLKKKTTAGIKYIQETASNNSSDLFWASAPDAFEVLKGDNLLAKYTSPAKGIPKNVGSYPINDPDGYYTGFAAAGYGIMWNTRYLKAKKLPVPAQWSDLTKTVYHNHVGMSAPSRSGTTHLTVETLLQGDGWNEGWAKWKQIAGNFKTVTARSFGVPDGVNSGSFGVGIVIDFFGLSSKGSGFPVDFVYPKTTALVPANIGVLNNAPHPKAAKAFIDFLLSDQGQEILLNKKIRRLPVNPATYAKAPPNFPNPFKDGSTIGAAVNFDVKLSKSRYNLVNSMFDVMITYRMDDLRAATKAIQDAEAANGNSKLIAEAKALVAALPITEAEAADPAFAGIFKKKRKKATDKVTGRQAEVEQKWDTMVKANYAKAIKLANKAH
ncbi:MAG: extracellular solute-binding protein [Gammaproteobacteria bacterium]|jgi:ABC-type Fe3+ transport system substrate-binding protein|nr:extracellular solute-binding protein [Gammaproteobacteria bacterium]MBT3722019.1 extracellular solute-binding protein [Gammaproteobacteria bacterium]MBT4077564.1 extracellular solute-binding protein [Gammaproteobacteria bacterium]MBT4194986.1 extracellular solute-binding protein [Gammaproteobacteria bacterium]MBT4449472.1 extracellular solute-binding protein [Gammaproteobacteria bacterium]